MRAAASLLSGALIVLLAACGAGESPDRAEDPAPPVATPTAMPTAIPVPSGEVTVRATVLDDGDGPELCLGGVMDSLPPQCGGPSAIGFDWTEHGGDFEDVRGTRWGDFGVTGTFDGTDFTVTEVVPADEYDAPTRPEEEPIWHTPCETPEGGWAPVDATTTTEATLEEGIRVAHRLPGFGMLWVDHSAGLAPEETVLNVSVTEDPDGAEAAIRAVWGGPLCISDAPLSHGEIRQVGERMCDLPGVLMCAGDGYPIDVTVVFDDGTIQAWADREYGEGTVRVSSALTPVG